MPVDALINPPAREVPATGLAGEPRRKRAGFLYRPRMIALAAFFCAPFASGQDGEALAKHLVSLSNRAANPKGLCVVMSGSDLAHAMARGSGFFVIGQERDPAAMQASAKEAGRAGYLGSRFLAVESPDNAIVAADKSVNLAIRADIDDAALAALDGPMLVEKLAPHGGQAIVGAAAGSGRKLDKAKLSAWAGGCGAPCRIVEDGSGLWAVLERGPLPGAADWTHRYFAAHNNPVSSDTAFRWPPMTQWLAKPFHDGGSLALMAGGRVAILFSGQGSKADRRADKASPNRNLLLVRDASNGQELWRRAGDPAFPVERRLSQFILLPGAAYLIQPPSPVIVELDPATGADRRAFDLGEFGPEAKWIGFEDGILCALVGPLDKHQATGDQWRWFDRQYRAYGAGDAKDPYLHDLGDTLVGLDAKTGQVLWSHRTSAPSIHEATVGLRAGKLYALARGEALLCLEAKSGKVVWKNAGTASAWDAMAGQRAAASFGHQGALIISERDAGIIYIPNAGGLGFKLADGAKLWSYRGAWHPLIRGDKVFTASGAYGTKADPEYANAVFDLSTGQLDEGWKGKVPVGSACGSICQSPYFHYGSWGITYDFDRELNLGKRSSYNDHRNNCNAVGLFAGGMLFSQAYECTCGYKTPGQVMEISRGNLPIERPADASRLRRASGPGPAAERDASPADWPVARANNGRSASSSAPVPASAKLLWHSRGAGFPAPLYNYRSAETAFDPPQPLAVGDAVFVAGADGAVRALAASDGRERWAHYTGGRFYQAPAWWRGRVLAGSGDGFVYCLDAVSGRELWRFRAAPEERRMFVFGHAVSTWAVATGVTVSGDRAYFAAGLLNNNGAHLYGLDAVTGELRWQQNRIGGADTPDLAGFSPAGLPAIDGDRLLIRRNAFRLADGTPEQTGESGPFARYVGRFNDATLLVGGWRFFGDQNEFRAIKGNACGVVAVASETGSGSKSGAVVLAELANGFAAWNASGLALLPMSEAHLGKKEGAIADRMIYRPRPDLDNTLAAEFAEMKAAKRPGETGLAALAKPKWEIERARFFGCALAPNAVVATFGEWDDALAEEKPRWARPGDRWFVGAFDPSDGTEVWRVELPGIPSEDGIAIGPRGDVIIQLLDGSVAAAGGGR